MKRNLTHKITFAGIMLAIAILMQFLKNISPYISGPIINTIIVVVTLELGLVWGIGFSIAIPIISMLMAPAMTMLATTTYGVSVIIIILGNIIFIVAAWLARKFKIYNFIIALIIGAVLKWLFMWGAGSLILLPAFGDKLAAAINKIFSTLQLVTALISIVIIIPVKYLVEKLDK